MKSAPTPRIGRNVWVLTIAVGLLVIGTVARLAATPDWFAALLIGFGIVLFITAALNAFVFGRARKLSPALMRVIEESPAPVWACNGIGPTRDALSLVAHRRLEISFMFAVRLGPTGMEVINLPDRRQVVVIPYLNIDDVRPSTLVWYGTSNPVLAVRVTGGGAIIDLPLSILRDNLGGVHTEAGLADRKSELDAHRARLSPRNQG